MGRHVSASSAERLSRLPRAIVLGAILLLSAVLLWTITVAPLVVGGAITIGAAAAWCRWLELHPDESEHRPDSAAIEREHSGY